MLLTIFLFLFSALGVKGEISERYLHERNTRSNELKLIPVEGKLKGGDGLSRSSDGKKFVGWTSTDAEVYWDVDFSNIGKVEINVALANSMGNTGSTLQVKVENEGKAQTLNKKTEFTGGWDKVKLFNMGSVMIEKPGKAKIAIKALTIMGTYAGDLFYLLVKGSAADGAKVVDIIPTGADSVHLTYPTDDGSLLFYNEVIVDETYPATFFMACGYQYGYLGMQDNDFKGKKIAIFSLWDVVDQERTNPDDLASVVKKGKDVTVKRFGGEGTGFQSIYNFQWNKGNKYSFLLHAKPEGRHTIFSGFVYLPDKKQWKLLSSLKRLAGSTVLSHFYSFLEDWLQNWGQFARQASFNPWEGDGKGNWKQLKRATFTKTSVHDNVNAWVDKTRFYLRTGGVTKNAIKPYETIERQVTDKVPDILKDVERIIKEEKYLP
uniref:Scol-DUF3472 n=1 Tax=Scolopendra viridis TaxID=118503 RepID=A0A4D5R9G7_SCOVI